MRYVDHARFGNVSTADLIEREREARDELTAMQETIKARLIADAGIIVGRVYRVADDGKHLAGRRILVHGVNAGTLVLLDPKFWCFAWGRMNGKSAAGDGWTIKCQQVGVGRLTLEDE